MFEAEGNMAVISIGSVYSVVDSVLRLLFYIHDLHSSLMDLKFLESSNVINPCIYNAQICCPFSSSSL